MSLYNMVYGANPATFFILPMLAEKHPDSYPRFRDCFAGKMTRSKTEKDQLDMPCRELDFSKKVISVYLRVGGGNRESYAKEIEELRKAEGFIEDYDDSFDNTFAVFLFAVPEKFEKDYDSILEGNIENTSEAYQQRIRAVYPKLKEKLDVIFKKEY